MKTSNLKVSRNGFRDGFFDGFNTHTIFFTRPKNVRKNSKKCFATPTPRAIGDDFAEVGNYIKQAISQHDPQNKSHK